LGLFLLSVLETLELLTVWSRRKSVRNLLSAPLLHPTTHMNTLKTAKYQMTDRQTHTHTQKGVGLKKKTGSAKI